MSGWAARPRRSCWSLFCLLVAWIGAHVDAHARILFVEVHYHPRASVDPQETLEFVEIFNDEPLDFDISDYQLAGGIAFRFPRGTIVPARSVVVVARDPERLQEVYGIEGVLGPFFGRLDNGGDELTLLDTGGSTVSRLRYNDRGRWPAAADGAGPSLVLRDELLAVAESESWGWSVSEGGTPGVVSFETVTSGVVINEVSRAADGAFVELVCVDRRGVDLDGHRLTYDPAGAAGHVFPEGSRLRWRDRIAVATADLGFELDPLDQRLYLFAPGAGVVVDARYLRTAPERGSEGRFPDGALRWLRLDPPTRGEANRLAPTVPLVINEIHYHPHSEDRREEFVELTNIGAEPVDLEGFEFSSGVRFVFPPGTVIAPGGFVVVASDPGVVEALHGIEGVLGPFVGTLADGGEMLRLIDRTSQPVDEVRYRDDGSWSRWPDGDGPSLELVDARSDNSAGSAWLESDHGAASEWGQYEYTARQNGGDSELHIHLMGAGDMLIDDIEIVQVGDDVNLIPGGSFDGDDPLRSWRIEGTHIDSRLEPGGGVDGTAALRIVASKRGDSRVNRIERQTTGNMVRNREYTVRFKARWLRGADGIMTRSFNHGIARVTRVAVPRGGGTPGAQNSRSLPDGGPTISGVTQAPALPAPDDPVTVTCRVGDPDGVAGVTLHWRLDGDDDFTDITMSDDGVGPDELESDGIYSATIAGAGSVRSVAELFVSARDGGGLDRVFPAGAPGTTLIYQYDDRVAPTDVPAYRVILRERDHRELRTRSPLSNHVLPASLVVEGRAIRHLGGLRYRGSPYLRRDSITGSQKGLRVNLPEEQSLRTSTRVTLDEQAADVTLQVDRLVRSLLQKAGGVQYGERRHVHLIYRGVSHGTYEEVLTVDPAYLERAYGPDGADGGLYKIDAHYEISDSGGFGNPRFTSWRYSEEEETFRFIYKKRSHEKQDDFTDLIELLDLMDQRRTSGEEFDARVADLIDIDQWVRGMAVYRACEDWDTIGGWTGKNVYLYHHPDGRWRFIPWDHDVAFGAAALLGEHNARAYLYTPHFPEIRRLLRRPALDRKFNGELVRLLDEDYDRGVIDPVLDATYSLLSASSGARPPNGIKSFVNARRAFMLSRIDDPEALTIETNGGDAFTTDTSPVTLSGKAPFDIDTLLISGSADEEPPSVQWTDRETWSVDVVLRVGPQSVSIIGSDRRGDLVDALSIGITYEPSFVPFVRGDSTRDGHVNLTDAVVTLDYLFRGREITCADAVDADDSGEVNLTDAVFILDYLFRGGGAPPSPFPVAGEDPTVDELGCE